ncbi:hypothetical protein TRFO_20410 [Tritrichomonas foetus]|uniref:Uncharacterized protein n=1 Tax=Tritrichomonas foetus TaxID=1144522 RepID=A0A1J4KKN6_9EUKA|nr:hypothetical protein TRFO_20410 [Tritrichomonas foetus]|eukprot:OHT10364.1 hypothetical protein TRFO_20410 [Tritrichomonas foetus]
MKLGISLLCKLGLQEDEIEDFNKPEESYSVYARDQVGIGYTPPTTALPDLNSAYARLASISMMNKNNAPKLEIKPANNRFFIPSKLKKKDVGSLSNDDISSIFIQSNSLSEHLKELSEEQSNSRRRRRHHRHGIEESTESPVATPCESQTQQEQQTEQIQKNSIPEEAPPLQPAEQSENAQEAQQQESEIGKRRRRRKRHHRTEQEAAENV